jgi:hypothetical protein
MTTPTVIAFSFDMEPAATPKVFLRTLLYSSSVRGKVIEDMHVELVRQDGSQSFRFWGHGESRDLVKGSGLYVGAAGVAAYHHFVLSSGMAYAFLPGTYTVKVFALVAGRRGPTELCSVALDLPSALSEALSRHDGVLFERTEEGYVGRTKSGR